MGCKSRAKAPDASILLLTTALALLGLDQPRAQAIIHEFRGALGEQFGAAVVGPGDIDLDGYPDLAVAAPMRGGGVGAVDLFSGRTGAVLRTLIDPASTGLGRELLRAGDVDRDGYADLWVRSATEVLGYSGRTGNLLWRFPSADFVVAGGDVDRDGHADLLAGVADAGGSAVAVAISGRTGAVVWSHIAIGQQLLALATAGDSDGDGHDDLVITVEDRSGYPRLLELRSGRTAAILRSEQVSSFHDIGAAVGPVGDYDHDGRDDYFVYQARISPPPTATVGAVSLVSGATGNFLRSHQGHFYCDRYSNCFIFRVLTGAGAIGDFDGDGQLDPLFTVDGNQEGTTRAGESIFVPSEIVAVAGDVDRDGRHDVLVGLPALGRARVQRLLTTRRWRAPGYVPRIGSTHSVRRIGDLDRDGYDDLAFSSLGYTAFGNANACVLLSGDDGRALATFPGANGFPTVVIAGAAGDVDRDGNLDVVVGWNSGNGPPDEHHAEVRGGSGQLLFRFDSAALSYGVAVAGGTDWNADQHPDVFVASATFTEVRSGRDGALLTTILAGAQTLEVVGDVDGDGQGDLAVDAAIYSSRNAQLIWSLSAPPTPAGDVDGDRYADLWLRDVAGPTLVSGRTRTALRVLPWPRGVVGASLAGRIDWNGDGIADLVVGAPSLAPSGLAVAISGLDGRELYTWEADRRNDGLGATVAMLGAPSSGRPSFAATAASGGPLLTGYAVHVRADTEGGAATYGAGCIGRLGAPRLGWIGRPRLGYADALTVRQAAPSAAAAFLIGGSEDQWLGNALPLPLAGLGLLGCTLHTAVDVVVPATTGAGGSAALPLAIPNVPALVSARLFAQTLAADATANPAGLSVSNAVRMVIGR